MKAENIEQIKEHLQNGGRAWLNTNGGAFEVDSVDGSLVRVKEPWTDGHWRTGFNSALVDYWELDPIPVVEKTRHPEWVERQIDFVLPRINIRSKSPTDDSAFLSLPITFGEVKWEGPFGSMVTRQGTVAELLKVWNIDDESEMSEMAQVLRHLRNAMR